MQRVRAACATFLFVVLAAPAGADTSKPIHRCRPPILHSGSTTQDPGFVRDMQSYRRCLQQFIEEQQLAAQRHYASAQAAGREWQEFAEDKGLLAGP